MSEHPLDGHVYKRLDDGTHWSFVGRWKHPEHRDYHVNWTGEYAVVQVYGVFSNPPRLVYIPEWDSEFTIAWEPMKICKFCGFTRMKPCLVSQTCANLTDYRLEPDEAAPEELA